MGASFRAAPPGVELHVGERGGNCAAHRSAGLNIGCSLQALRLCYNLGMLAQSWVFLREFFVGAHPIVVRELRSRLRTRGMFLLMFLYLALLSIVVLTSFAAATRAFTPRPDIEPGRLGFLAVAVCQVCLLCLVAAVQAATSLTMEKEKQTLDLVKLATISPASILLGKVIAVCLMGMLLAFAGFPVFGLCLLMGGVSLTEMIVVYGMTLTYLLLYATVGVCTSAVSKSTPSAVARTVVGLGFLNFLTLPLIAAPAMLACLNPVAAIAHLYKSAAQATFFGFSVPFYVLGLPLLLLFSFHQLFDYAWRLDKAAWGVVPAMQSTAIVLYLSLEVLIAGSLWNLLKAGRPAASVNPFGGFGVAANGLRLLALGLVASGTSFAPLRSPSRTTREFAQWLVNPVRCFGKLEGHAGLALGTLIASNVVFVLLLGLTGVPFGGAEFAALRRSFLVALGALCVGGALACSLTVRAPSAHLALTRLAYVAYLAFPLIPYALNRGVWVKWFAFGNPLAGLWDLFANSVPPLDPDIPSWQVPVGAWWHSAIASGVLVVALLAFASAWTRKLGAHSQPSAPSSV